MKLARHNIIATAALAVGGCIAFTQSEFVIDIEPIGDDVIITGTGSLDVSNLTAAGPFAFMPGLFPDSGFFIFSEESTLGYIGSIVTPGPFGTSASIPLTTGTNDAISFVNFTGTPIIGVPEDYISGTPLFVNNTIADADLKTLGLTEGEYIWSWPGDQITMRILKCDGDLDNDNDVDQSDLGILLANFGCGLR